MERSITREEARSLSKEKVEKVKALCKELQVELSAKTRVDSSMFIEPIVIFTDIENYNIKDEENNKKEELKQINEA